MLFDYQRRVLPLSQDERLPKLIHGGGEKAKGSNENSGQKIKTQQWMTGRGVVTLAGIL